MNAPVMAQRSAQSSSSQPQTGLGALWRPALKQAFVKLDPRQLVRSPVMLVVELTALVTSVLCFVPSPAVSTALGVQIALWLWFTVLFANFAEALAEGRGKARADSLKSGSQGLMARKQVGAQFQSVPASSLRKGDVVRVEAGELIPGDGEVIEGVAAVNEAAITGESAPVIRESGGDRSAVTGNTRLVSDWLLVRISANPGESTLDRMIALVEGARRQITTAQAEVGQHRIHRSFTISHATHISTGQARLGAEGDQRHAATLGHLHRVQRCQVLDDGLALGRVVALRGQQRRLGQIRRRHPRRLDHGAAAAVAKGDGAGLVQQQGVHVARRLHGAAGLGDDVEAHQAIHTGDADGREQAADGGRDQRHQQRRR